MVKNKFTSKVTEEEPQKEKIVKNNSEIIKKGEKVFKKCSKCGWIHPAEETLCRFCGNKI